MIAGRMHEQESLTLLPSKNAWPQRPSAVYAYTCAEMAVHHASYQRQALHEHAAPTGCCHSCKDRSAWAMPTSGLLAQLYAQQCMRLACVWLRLNALPTLLCGSLRLCIGWQVGLRRLAGVRHHSTRWQAVGAIWVHRHGQRDLHACGGVQGCRGRCACVSLEDKGARGLLSPESVIVAGRLAAQACTGLVQAAAVPKLPSLKQGQRLQQLLPYIGGAGRLT